MFRWVAVYSLSFLIGVFPHLKDLSVEFDCDKNQCSVKLIAACVNDGKQLFATNNVAGFYAGDGFN